MRDKQDTPSNEVLAAAATSDNHNPADQSTKKAKRGGGPKTEAGKLKSAQNSRKYGILATNLFRPEEVGGAEYQSYTALLLTFITHYQPCGPVEQFLVEKVATEALRLRRLLAFERDIFSKNEPFLHPGVDKLLRYQSTYNRQFFQALAELERQQRSRLGDDVPAPVSVDVRVDAYGGNQPLQAASPFAVLQVDELCQAPQVPLLSLDENGGQERREREMAEVSNLPTADEDSADDEGFCETNSSRDLVNRSPSAADVTLPIELAKGREG
jgi:hypothetical protein